MKKIIAILCAVMMALMLCCFTACGEPPKDGVDGKSAYEIWLDNGHSGTQSDFLEWLKGGKGDTGLQGEKGDTGSNGKSAYQTWLDNGHTGSEEDFLAWIKGDKGDQGEKGNNGTDGMSAYEIYLKYNPDYTGSEEQWINDLVSGNLPHKEEYVFEAEYTDLRGKSGPGLAGSAPGTAMILYSDDLGASNGYFIGYQYDINCSLEFYIESDKTINDATISLSLSAEHHDFNMNPDNYQIYLNGVAINYSEIQFKNVPAPGDYNWYEISALPFKDYVIAIGASLKEGVNIIQLKTANKNAIEGTTMLADAPLIDCLKITTKATLTWSSAHGLPMLKNTKFLRNAYFNHPERGSVITHYTL